MPRVTPFVPISRLAVVLMAACLIGVGLLWPLTTTVIAGLLVVAIAPVGRFGVERVAHALLLALVLGQLGYAFGWPAPLPPRLTVAWVLAAAALLMFHAMRPDPVASLRAALPRVGAPEVAVAVFGLGLVWWFQPWVGDADHSLARLFLGWDHSGHFAMVEQLRDPVPAAADLFAGYPRGYHAVVAALMEVSVGRPVSLDTEIVAYAQSAVVAVSLSLVLAVAQACSVPAFRRRPVLLVPLLAGLVTLYLLIDDTAQATYYGFGGFLMASALVTAAALLLPAWSRERDPWTMFLFGAAVAGVFGTWTMLLPFLVAVPPAVWIARRGEPGLARRLATALPWAIPLPLLARLAHQTPVAALSAEGDAAGSDSLLGAVDRILLAGGAIRTNSLGWPVLFAVAGVVLPVAVAILAHRRSTQVARAELRAVATLAGVAAVALAMSGAMLGYEVARVGGPRYYGIKVLCATTMVAGTLGLVAAATAADAWAHRSRRGAVQAGSGVVAVLLLFALGSPIPLGALALAPGASVRRELASTVPDRRGYLAASVRAACGVIDGRRGEYYLLVPGVNHEDAVRAGVWIISCGLNWGSDQPAVLRQLLPDRAGQGAEVVLDVPRDASRILATRSAAVVLVPEAMVEQVRKVVGPLRRERVLGF